MKVNTLLVGLGLLSTLTLSAQTKISGFPQQQEQQLQLEKAFTEKLKASDLDEWMKYLSAHPHPVGSKYSKPNAEYIADKFKSWGFDTKIVTYYALFPTPKVRLLEMTSPTDYKAVLEEPALKEDATSGQKDEQLPTYNAYSHDGDVTAELVFVNYGVPEDYEELERRGIDVKGKIAIAKYAGSWRGIKPKVAAEHGAIGCIIYSDPKDDGYFQGDVYPKGPFKPENGVQRGSVLDISLYEGDPLTPGYASTKKAKRIPQDEATNLVKIPVLPISYHDAKPLLEALQGPVAPASWRGALPITYHLGPGPAKVHIKLEFNWDIQPIYDVIATLKGTTYPDQWVIRGNHHDAWVNGASDPISGQVALMEEAKAVGELAKEGHRPKRTMIYCAWDGEEPALIGSTEWAEEHADELRQKAVAYINSDGNGRGFLRVGGSHTLETMVKEVASTVKDPQYGVSVLERRLAAMSVDAGQEESDFHIYALGSGSDYTTFLQHLGIASLNLGYGGENRGGEYHSIYDSYDMYTRFKDPGFPYGVALAETAGKLSLRLANAEVLPFDFGIWYQTVAKYGKQVMDLTEKKRKENEQLNTMINDNYYTLASDPTKTYIPPKPKSQVPFLNFAPLENALTALKSRVDTLKTIDVNKLTPAQQVAYNELVYHSERHLIREEGLPGRPWYKNQIYAPGFYTGYGVKTMPGVREAIEEEQWDQAQVQIGLLADLLNNYAGYLDKVIAATK